MATPWEERRDRPPRSPRCGHQRGHPAHLHLRHHGRAQGRHAHPQHRRRCQQPAPGAARHHVRQRHPHGLDAGPPHRVPLRRKAPPCRMAPPACSRTCGTRRCSSTSSSSTGSPTPPPRRPSSTTPCSSRDRRAEGRQPRPLLLHGCADPTAMVRHAKEILPQMLVLGGWGQTENALVTLSRPGDPEEKIVETDGYPWPGMEIRTVELDARNAVPAGTEGRLQVRGPFLFVGYAKRLEMTRASFEGAAGSTPATSPSSTRTATSSSPGAPRTSSSAVARTSRSSTSRTHSTRTRGSRAWPSSACPTRGCRTSVACVALKPGPASASRTCRSSSASGVARQYWPERLEILDELPRPPAGRS